MALQMRLICIIFSAICLEASKAGHPPATSRQSIIRGDGSRHSFEIVHDKHVGGVWGESWPHGYGGLPAVYAPTYDHHHHRVPEHYHVHPHHPTLEVLPAGDLGHHHPHSHHLHEHPHEHHGLEHLPVLGPHHGHVQFISLEDAHGPEHHGDLNHIALESPHGLGHHGLEHFALEGPHGLDHHGNFEHLELHSPHTLEHHSGLRDLALEGPHGLEHHGGLGHPGLEGPHGLDHFNSPQFIPAVNYVPEEHHEHHEHHGPHHDLHQPLLFIPHEEHRYAPHHLHRRK